MCGIDSQQLLFLTPLYLKPSKNENLICLISESKDALHICIYNKTREIHYNLMLKSVSLLVILLVTKIGCFITLSQISKRADFDKKYFLCLSSSK